MSRHRALNLDDDDYDDESDYASSYDGSYGASPALSQYMYNRNNQNATNLSSLINTTNKKPQQPVEDQQLLKDCIEYIEQYAGKGTFTRNELVEVIRANDYNAEAALDELYDEEEQEQEPVKAAPAVGIQIKSSGANKGSNNKKNTNNNTKKQPQQQPKATPAVVVTTTKDDAAFSARDQSKISHKAENVKFKPIVKQQGANKPKAKSGLTVELAEVDKKPAKDEAKTPTTPFSFKPKGPAPTDESKQRVNVVIIGHVDAGKSTLMGHLLVQTGMVSDKQLHKFKKESQEKGKASFAYAWVLDEHPEERERGVTIDVGVRYFDTPNRHVTILDAPGHRDFIPNMITGASQADMAILVVDASIGEFESGFQSGGQTKEHLILARSLGVSEVLVVVNKLDMVNWDQERFNYISEQIGLFMKQIGYRGEKDAVFIPGSGLNGINLVDRASKTAQDKKNPAASEAAKLAQWYDGPSIVEHIDHFTPANRDVEKPFRMSINDVYKTLQTGVTVAGRVDSGHISIDDHLLVVPLNEMCVVKTILRHKGNVQTAYAGDNVELGLGKIDINMLNVGSILCDPAHPIQLAKKFEARIATFEMDIPITKGAQVVLHIHNINVPAVVSRLKCTLNKHQEVLKKKPRVLSSNTTAIVEVKLSDKQTIPLERYADFPTFGRFMLRANGKTVAAGMATEILDSKSSKKSKAE